MSAAVGEVKRLDAKRRIRNGALALTALALAFYIGFIVLLVYRSHH